MKKIDSFDDLRKFIGEETLRILLEDYSSLKEEFRNEKIERILGGEFIADSEMGVYKINQKDILILKPKGETVIYIPL